MYKIGIIGHSPEHFSDPKPEDVCRSIGNIIELLRFQYGENVIFNTVGETGIGLWTAEECLKKETRCKYHIFMPCYLQVTSDGWLENQAELLEKCYNNAYSITVCSNIKSTNKEEELESYRRLIDDSNFVICFWVGKKQGKTFEAIKYALSTNKMVLNGLDKLCLLTNEDIRPAKHIRKKI
jgi:hypothetical protein